MKYLRVASDLHLEGFSGRNPDTLMIDFLPHDERDAESALVLAGDISSGPDQLVFFLRACIERFNNVFFVPGNHEYYRHNYNAWNLTMTERLDLLVKENPHAGNLYFVTDGVVQVEVSGVRFILSTLWGDGGPTMESRAVTGHYLNDFRLISKNMADGIGRFTVFDMMEEFKKNKAGIRAELERPFEGKTVVITHHLPSRRLVSARFWPRDGSDGCNGGFVGDCDNILAYEELAPKLWIHGHTHDTIDTELWGTRIVCNPAGYRSEWFSKVNTFKQVGRNGPETVPKFVEL